MTVPFENPVLKTASQSRAGRVLVTGASSGIGRATARAFANAGFDVALVARLHDALETLADELSEVGVMAQSFAVDLSDLHQIEAHMAHLLSTFGRVDVLVNNAGMGYTGALSEMPLADWQRVMDLNVTSIMQVMQAVLPGMRSRQNGLIVNVASIAAQTPFPEWGAYGVSKAALVALSNAIALEESPHGIRVMTLCPGAVDTPLWESSTVKADFDRTQMLRPETVAQTILYAALLPETAVMSQVTLTPTQGAL